MNGPGAVPPEQWDARMRQLLDHMLKVEASDLYITADSPPVFRIAGVGYPAKQALTADFESPFAEITDEDIDNLFND